MVHGCGRFLAALGMAALLSPTSAWAQAGPDLVIAMSHSGNFTVGANGIYTIVVSNIGGGIGIALTVCLALAGIVALRGRAR
jgi:hypothetical protein